MSARIYPAVPPMLPPERRRWTRDASRCRFEPLTAEDLARARAYVARILAREIKRRRLTAGRVPA
ncbi:hypothetical protein GQ464_008660 [Rhodocaloribacter litoris]|uniref:hypothetical protein n=1 Tax=Rhodocaloribacter litoris TaxID=2558931 RepID=UPI0014209B86|nr:hypothetical protein [Rhodocaloribacter litoris]QXD16988.1 hypothetical protein GQ464_008660 [Rhodocaloribacter litoris]